MKIGFVFQKDSHFKSVFSTYQRLKHQYQFQAIFFGIDAQYNPIQSSDRDEVIYLSKTNLKQLLNCDYLICCLGGYLLNYIVRQTRETPTKVISLFPGIVSRYQLDAFLSRVNADAVWLNSKFDYELYLNICKILKVSNNGYLYGMSWVESTKFNKLGLNNHVIIFEQTEILDSQIKKSEYERILIELITSNPTIKFRYKTRRNVNDNYFFELVEKLSKFINVTICHTLNVQDIEKSGIYLSVSSSALIEGLLLKRRSLILSQKLQDTHTFEFYKESGLLLEKYNLAQGGIPNEAWLDSRVMAPSNNVKLTDIRKRQLFNFEYLGSIWHIFILIFRISLITKKPYWCLISKRNIIAIKRCLVYVNGK